LSSQSANIRICNPQFAFLFYDLPEDLQFVRRFPQIVTNRKDLESSLSRLLGFPLFQLESTRVFTIPSEAFEDFTCEDSVTDFRDNLLSLCAITRQQRHYSVVVSEREWFRNCTLIWESIRQSIV